MSIDTTPEGRALELKRVMGPKLLLLFIVGDILGTGVYALTGQVAAEVGGAAWVPFLVAFGVALLTAFSYLELVTKYPQAAGAALYVHTAFGVHFFTHGYPARPRRGTRCTRHPDQGRLTVHLDVRGRQLGPHQPDDGQPAAVRNVAPGRSAAIPGQGAPEAPDALHSDLLHHRVVVRAHRLCVLCEH